MGTLCVQVFHLVRRCDGSSEFGAHARIRYYYVFQAFSEHLQQSQNYWKTQKLYANLYCNFAYLHWEGCVICSIYLR